MARRIWIRGRNMHVRSPARLRTCVGETEQLRHAVREYSTIILTENVNLSVLWAVKSSRMSILAPELPTVISSASTGIKSKTGNRHAKAGKRDTV